MNLYHSQNCPANALHGATAPGPMPVLDLALDRERLQKLIDLLACYDLDSECDSSNADLSIQLRAFGPLQS